MKLIRSTALATALLATAVTANAGLIANENFESGPTGWSNNAITYLGTSNVLGGFREFGAGAFTEKTFALSGNQAGVNISFDFWKGDSWDNETFFASVNGIDTFSGSFWGGQGSQVGGQIRPTSWNELLVPVSFTSPLTTNSVTLRFMSTLDSSANDEWWAIDNVVISEVPEPASIALLGLGLLGLSLSRKKKA